MDWSPSAGDWTARELIGHLLDCISGFCAVLAAAEPQRLAAFHQIARGACGRSKSSDPHIEEGFALLTDADLARRVPTVFVAQGESMLTLLLGNLEHLINHKHQLFTYLKQMGVPVATPDLYRFRLRQARRGKHVGEYESIALDDFAHAHRNRAENTGAS